MEKKSFVAKFACESKSFELLHTQNELEKKMKTYNSVNLSKLPDKGARLKAQIDELEDLLKTLSLEVVAAGDSKDKSEEKSLVLNEKPDFKDKRDPMIKSKTFLNEASEPKKDVKENVPLEKSACFGDIADASKFQSFKDFTPKKNTKQDSETVMNSPAFKNYRDTVSERRAVLTEAKPLIENLVSKTCHGQFHTNPSFQTSEECVKKLHSSVATYPDDTLEESDPEDLKSSLMVHQKRGLAWLMWREEQDPRGGILADDMGLGKTLTMISLILKQKERCHYFSHGDEERGECRGTLIVCLASIIRQWQAEVTKHCEGDALRVLLYHGPQRERDFRKIRDYDVVLTTYSIVMCEKKSVDTKQVESLLFKLKWERIILDEAHTIKNHNSQTANAIFSLRAFKRWAVTGTPIHNVFKDIYSLVKFLQLSPFDDLKKFKTLTDESSESGEQRRNLLIKTIVLRRTKDQVDEWGKPLVEMSHKSTKIHYIDLSSEERIIYDKLNAKVTKKFTQFLNKPSELRSSSLLVLLLRLQQCCSHLGLLENEAEDDDISTDITSTLSSLTIDEASSDSSSSRSSLDRIFDNLEIQNLQNMSVKSSKIKALFVELNKISELSQNKDKSVIVSQWVSMLKIVSHHLDREKIDYHLIAGNTRVEDRQKFADDFNHNENGVKIMLLSLKAGGVGLNLVGANHLFLLDLHWNPALEMQACDRIHRVGQNKDVVIHKFTCRDTIEEKIKALQDEKSRIACNALSGSKKNTKGLSLDDFKELFNVRK